jgi:hypothetical protein
MERVLPTKPTHSHSERSLGELGRRTTQKTSKSKEKGVSYNTVSKSKNTKCTNKCR